MKALKKLIFVILCVALLSAFMYTSAFACSAEKTTDDAVYFSSETVRIYVDSDYSTIGIRSGINFNSLEEYFYNQIKEKAAAVAAGSDSSTAINITTGISELSWTKEELGGTILSGGSLTPTAQSIIDNSLAEAFDTSYILASLLVDCPYEMFWFDKTGGIGYSYEMKATSSELSIASITLKLYVSDDYSAGTSEFEVSASKIAAANKVLTKINAIVEEHKGKGDYEKLVAYKDEICELVSYNFDALTAGTSYGNPWQLIYVFDENPDTNVVCEGYAKAFKYLCDLSEFEKDIYCYITSGEMTSNKSEHHMWNVVKIGESNYIVDVTNTDYTNGSGGFNLFLVGAAVSNSGKTYTVSVNGNTIRSIKYEYADTQKDLFCADYLVISGSEYQNHIDEHSYGSKWVSNSETHWHECSCGDKADVSAHTSTSPATCIAKAVCSVCNIEYGEFAEHNFGASGECSLCGYAPEVDLPSDDGTGDDYDNGADDNYDDGLDDGYDDNYDGEYDDDFTYDDEEDEEPKSFFEWLLELILSFIRMIFGIEEEA